MTTPLNYVRLFRYGVVIAFCFGALWCFLLFLPSWRLNRIEHRAMKVITGDELQKWGTQILAAHPVPPGDFLILRSSEVKVPLPKVLIALYHNPPTIFVYETRTNSPGYVRITWGGGDIGHCGFEIGPTNFDGARGQHKWQDGVYFWNEH